MYEMYDVLVQGIVARWHDNLGTARLPSPKSLALVVGSHGPADAINSLGPPAFVVNSTLAAKIVELAVVLNFTGQPDLTCHLLFPHRWRRLPESK